MTQKNRPVDISILTLIIFWLVLWNGLRLGEALFFWKTLTVYGAKPLYIATSSGVWLLVGLFLFWALFQQKRWLRVAILGGAIGYSLWYWFDRLVLQEPHSNWPFVLVANIIALLIILFLLFSHQIRRLV